MSNGQQPNNWTASLISILPASNDQALTDQQSSSIAISLTKLNFELALRAEKIFQLKLSIGEAIIFKTISALLKMFSDATKVNKPLSSSEIILCTDWIVKKYTHESIADFALALKEGIFGSHKFYGAITIADVKEVMEKYFEGKAENLKAIHEKHKTANNDTGNTIVKTLVQSYTNDYSETFKEIFDREKRASAQKQVNDWREKMKTPDFNYKFEPQENDYHKQKTTPPLEG